MSNAALTLKDVSVAVGGRVVVSDVSHVFARGSITAVVGRSGAGKSVLLKAVAGLLARQSGSVTIGAPPLIFVHQDPALFDDRSVIDNLTFFALARGREQPAHVDSRARAIATRLNLTGLLDAPANSLSPAQARRVALARALVMEPGVLIVDEPTTGLDPIAADDVDSALVSSGLVGALIVVTHSPRTLRALQSVAHTHTLLVHDGRVVEQQVAA